MIRVLRCVVRSLVVPTLVLAMACGGGGGGGGNSTTPPGNLTAVPPVGLIYSQNPANYTKTLAILPNHPSSSGGAIVAFGIAPDLPAGLTLDPGNGDITGIPTAIHPPTTYTITGTNSGGATSTPISITVNDVAPSFLYGGGSFTFTTGTPILPLVPVQTGGTVVGWAIQPALPAGLAFSDQDGSIGGTPTAISPSTGYAVTGSNTGGEQSAGFTLRTLPPPPTISVRPADTTANVGETATFGVTAAGTGPLSYQWSKGGTDLPGATAPSYTTPFLALAEDQATYRVAVSDTYGSVVTSSLATLTVSSDLTAWLNHHASVAAAIRWQFRPASGPLGVYQPPADADKLAWSHWSQAQKDELDQAYQDARAWFAQGAPQVAMGAAGLTDEPANQHPQSLPNPPTNTNDNVTAMEWVTPAYMWKLYLAHVAFALAQEITHPLPWSLTTDSAESLRYLFDSSVMAWSMTNGNFGMGTYGGANFPPLRADNRPQTAFAPPMWTYPWLHQAGLIGNTRLETIGKVLEWMRQNLAHFNGADTFGTYTNVWQYRGFAPLSQIVNGTYDATDVTHTLRHWTAGCHGSVGFLHEVLRVLNIPVQPVWVSGHELACFTSEKKYLDHGDDPYNAVVRGLPAVPILSLLIDEPTYQSRFTSDLTVNITDPSSPALINVGYAANHFQ